MGVGRSKPVYAILVYVTKLGAQVLHVYVRIRGEVGKYGGMEFISERMEIP